MLIANLILLLIVVYILLKNHLLKNRHIVYGIIAIIATSIKLMSSSYPISEFEAFPIILTLVLHRGFIAFLPIPFAILYLNGILPKSQKIGAFAYLLILPPLIYTINFIPYLLLPIADKIQMMSFPNSAKVNECFIWISLNRANAIRDLYNNICGGILLIFMFRIIRQGKQSISKKNYFTLIQLVVIMGTIFIVVTFNNFILHGNFKTPKVFGLLPLLIPLSFIFFPNYLFDNTTNNDLTFYLKIVNRFTKNGEKTEGVDNEIILVSSAIMNYLHHKKPYLSPGFSIHDIVTHLNIPQKTVTDCFNKVIKIPFPRMRNQLRIDYAMEQFKNDAHLKNSISGIATDAGFKNRATFYIAFKEVTKMTPIEWINKNCDSYIEDEAVNMPHWKIEKTKIKAGQKQTLNFNDDH
jgi:AraC-like DNA-binding protein